jgi:hypothetical protein
MTTKNLKLARTQTPNLYRDPFEGHTLQLDKDPQSPEASFRAHDGSLIEVLRRIPTSKVMISEDGTTLAVERKGARSPYVEVILGYSPKYNLSQFGLATDQADSSAAAWAKMVWEEPKTPEERIEQLEAKVQDLQVTIQSLERFADRQKALTASKKALSPAKAPAKASRAPRNRCLASADVAEMRRMYRDGDTYATIAEAAGISETTAKRAVAGLGTYAADRFDCSVPPCPPRPRGKTKRQYLSPKQALEVRKKYETGGHTHASLGIAFGVSSDTIRRAVLGLGSYGNV